LAGPTTFKDCRKFAGKTLKCKKTSHFVCTCEIFTS